MSSDVFRTATLDNYLAWLEAWVRAGNMPTRYEDHPFGSYGTWLLAQRDFVTGGETGALRVSIIVPPGIDHASGPLGHNTLYYLDGPDLVGHRAPVFNDPEFANIPGLDAFLRTRVAEQLAQNVKEEERATKVRQRAAASDIGKFLGRQP